MGESEEAREGVELNNEDLAKVAGGRFEGKIDTCKYGHEYFREVSLFSAGIKDVTLPEGICWDCYQKGLR